MSTARTFLWVIGVGVFLPSLLFGETVGPVGTVVGGVTAFQKEVIVRRGGKGSVVPVQGGEDVFSLDFYRTGIQSRLKILFEDDSILSVGEKSQIQITESVYDPANGKRGLTASLLAGKMKALAGRIFSTPGAKFEVVTPTAVASARGTIFIVWLTDVDGIPATGIVSLVGGVSSRSADPKIIGEVIVQEQFHTLVKKGFPPTEPSPISADLLAELVQSTTVANKVASVMDQVEAGGAVDAASLSPQTEVSLASSGAAPVSLDSPVDLETVLVNTHINVEIQFP